MYKGDVQENNEVTREQTKTHVHQGYALQFTAILRLCKIALLMGFAIF